MRFLIDEDTDVRLIRFLKRTGHDAKRVPSGTKNGQVLRLALAEDRVLITRDSDFTDSIRYPPARYPGIIHLDIHPPRWVKIEPAIKVFLGSVEPARLAGKLFELGEEGVVEAA